MANRIYHRGETGQFAKKPTDPQLVQETTSSQRPANHMGIWSGIEGQGQTGNLDFPGLFGGGLLYPGGGGFNNPMAFPGYGSLYTGNPLTYRWMLQHPVLRLVRSIDVGIIGASHWEYATEEGDSVPDEWIKLVSRTMDKLRPQLLADFFVRGRDYGWAGGELIWEHDERDGSMRITRVKQLLNDLSFVMHDPNGNFTGIRNMVSLDGMPEVDVPGPFKAWKYTFDSEAGYHYGRSWLENVRATAWKDWLDAAQDMKKLTGKISGIISVVLSPAGSFPGRIDPTTGKPKEISYRENAEHAIKALANGAAGVWFPSLGLMPDSKGNLDAMKVLIELAGKSLTNFQVLDFSGQSAAIRPILDRMIHAEENMFAGGLRSPRTGMEGKHGTKAEAEEHTDTGTLNAEMDDREFARQCQPIIDALLVVNAGPKARGRVQIKCPSLVDRKAAVLKAFLLGLLNEPHIARSIATSVGDKFSDVFKVLGIPNQEVFDAAKMMQEVEADRNKTSANVPDKRTKNPDPQGGRPPQE